MNGSLAGVATGLVLGIRCETGERGMGVGSPLGKESCQTCRLRQSQSIRTSPPPSDAVGRMPVGFAAGAVLAFTSAMVDVSGRKLVADGYVDDGETQPRQVYPSPPSNLS